jgi:flagellar biosynthesis chaperone FliJ
MNQAINKHTPPDQRPAQSALPEGSPHWQLERDREQLKYLYAQREEQLQQLARLQQMGAIEQLITIVQKQIAMLDHAIRQAEEQAALHERQAQAFQVE